MILPDADAVAALVADAVEDLLSANPDSVLGLATGTSPLPVYAELVARQRAGRVSFAKARAFLLDEYIGLPAGHPQSYRTFIEERLTAVVDFRADSVFGPNGAAPDLEVECARYEAAIAAAGGIDLQLLGIGADGHIGFNEPTSSLASRTRVKTLTDQTRHDNARFFDGMDDVPRHVITQGIGTILEARHIILIATGAAKASSVERAIEGPVTAMVPASALQLHPHTTFVIDEPAAARLSLASYYRSTYASKPAWQRL